ncbi:hypothetical protein EJB05_00888 [Eragrostis curvula]|uniref:RRM domain-containing protein n=1 Tax=Eragrostis curvula TaxID=38414 RepID=A0A5J9WNW3_9POAL|nr:hypothetical protein EJB05_00888 [Eragrostis curvula]
MLREREQVFSTCGEIVEVRIMKDQNGIPKLLGKKLDVDLSLDQDTLFFGNLHKEWSLEEFEELIHKTFKDVVSVDLAMASNFSSNKRHLNRGFAFVRFSSHGAAARAVRIGSRTDFLLGGILHPAINWAEKSHTDADEMAKTLIKTAFVGNLPATVNEEYLTRLFERFGEVERVAISRKGQYPVGFVHFASRTLYLIESHQRKNTLSMQDLDIAIEEMDGKTVSVARPAVDNDRKRTHEEEKTRRPNTARDRLDYSYERHGHGSFDRQGKAPRLSNAVVDITDPYESAIMSLPSAVKELLLRILRLGIGTRYDIDIHGVKILNELPEASAVAILKQFLISGGDKRNKGDYFASLIAKHQAPIFDLVHTLHGTYLPRNLEVHDERFPHEDYDYMTSGSSRYRSSGHYPSPYYANDPPMSEPVIRRYAEERPTMVRNPEQSLRQEEIINIRRYPKPTLVHESRHNTGKLLDRRYTQEQNSKVERSPEEAILSRERRLPHAEGYNTDIGPGFLSRSSAEYSAACQQVRFDPFTGEPYKFDPFTGEPIRPEPSEERSGSLY